MDPLSISAGIISLLQAANSLLILCNDIRSALHEAPWSLTRIVKEIRSLRDVVEALQSLIDGFEEDPSCHDGLTPRTQLWKALSASIEAPLEMCAAEIASLADTIRKCTPDGVPESKPKAITPALKWHMRDQDAKKSLERLARCKSPPNLALSSRNMATLVNIERITVSLNFRTAKACSRLESLMETLSTSNFNELQREVNSWLSPLRPLDNHDAVLQLHQDGTNDWFFGTRQFEDWDKGSNKIFWLSGPPGAGKTVLFSQIVEDLALTDSTALHGIAYCDFRNPESQSFANILGSLLGQLCAQLGAFPSNLIETYQRHKKSTTYSGPNLALLQQWLLDISKQRKVRLFIDALDDIDKGYQLSDILSRFVSGSTQLSVFLTSRNDVEIQKSLPGASRLRLEDHVTEIDRDIQSYVLDRIRSEPDLNWLSSEVTKTVLASLRIKSLGVFRWAQCQLDSIAQARTIKDVKQKISTLPEGLDETYDRIFRRVPAAYRDVFRKALNWLAFAVMPLTLEELWEAIAIERDTAFIDDESRLRGPQDILYLGRSLINVSTEGYVRLAHLSVRDYLLSATIRNSPTTSFFALDKREGHVQLALACLTYLFFDELRSGPSSTGQEYEDRLKRLPMLKYIATAWPYHIRAAAAEGGELDEAVAQFWHPDSRSSFMSWVQVINASANFMWNIYPSWATPLYYAASFGLTGAVQSLLASDEGRRDLNAPGSRFGGTPLHAAAIRNHVDIMRLLMDAGASPAKADLNGVAPLHSAAVRGLPDAVRLLLQYGAPTDVEDAMDHMTPLEWAARQGDCSAVMALLEAAEKDDLSSTKSERSIGIRTPSLTTSSSSEADMEPQNEEETVVWCPEGGHFPRIYERRSGLHSSIVLQFELDGTVTKIGDTS